MQVRDFAIGVEDHYGWANLVSIALSKSGVTLLDKRRVGLIDPQLPTSPYHHETLEMADREAEELLRAVKASANTLARTALQSLIGELDGLARCRAIAIRTPPLPGLPRTVAEVHADYWTMCRADGMIYHQALTDAAARLNVSVVHFDKSRVMDLAAQALRLSPAGLEAHLKAAGKALKPPWRRGHMVACAGAVAALGHAS